MAQVPPVAKPRTKLVKLSGTAPSMPPRDEVGSSPEWRELLAAIRRFTELESKPDSDILPEQRDAAMGYLASKKPLYYKHIQLGDLIDHNKTKPDNIRTALDKLFKYATNLLSPNPPRAWRSIKFATAFYHHHVKPVKGAQEILMSMGYSKDTGRALEFEADKPDYDKVTEITAELLVAKYELERMIDRGLLAEQGHVQQIPQSLEMVDELSVSSDVDRYGMVSTEPPLPPVAKPRKSMSSSSGSKPPTVRKDEGRDPVIHHTPKDHVHNERHPNDDDVDDEVLRLRREREEMMRMLKGSSPSTEIGSENRIKGVDDDEEDEKFYDASEESLHPNEEKSIRREPEGGSANDHQYQHRSPHQSGYSKDHYGHTVPSGGEPTGYNVPQGAVGPPHHKGDIHRGAGRPPNIEDISEYVDISRKDYIMSPEYKERKRKEFEEKQKREEDERRQKELYDDGFFFMSWLRECVKYGYEPEDVEHAVNHYRNTSFRTPLEYLQHEWEDFKRVVQRSVARNGKVGQPSLIEARDCLLEVGGLPHEAIETCIAKRVRKIREFMEQYPSATPREAAEYLTRYKLNVEVAVSVLQTDKLRPVVAFIWDDVEKGEPEEILKKEEARLCDLIKAHREKNVQYCCHLLMGECNLESEERASLVLKLMDGREFGQCITLAKNCRTMEEVERYSNQECPICFNAFMMDDMVNMLHCTCGTCKDCFKTQYTMVAREKGIANFNCFVCGEPDFGASDIDRDDYLTMFANLLKAFLDYDDYQLFQKKATEFALSKDDNFRWCAHCGCGFIHEPPANQRIRCPHCEKDMCFHCKKPWEEQHKGLTCIDFARWKAENDEENQQKGLAAFLKENGIECPKCKFRYDLAKGGCLHFKCGQCRTEFCGGCGAVFDKNCRKFQACGTKGFHAHHPRDCLSYLRDWEVERLQKVLQDKEIKFDTEPPQNQVNASQVKKEGEGEMVEEPPESAVAVGSANQGLRCRVMLQKEVGSDKVDEECGEDCKKGNAGLCEKHYKEYLVCKVNEAGIDPCEFMDVNEISAALRRDEKQVPNKQPNEVDQAYLQRLREHLKTEIALEKRGMFNL